MKLLFAIILLFMTLKAFSSALVSKDPEALILTFKSHLFLYGEVDSELALNIASEINNVWNDQSVEVPLDGSLYKLKFEVTASVVSYDEALAVSLSTLHPAFNFIRILPAPNDHLTASFMVGNTNSGIWLLSQGLGYSRTAAHEYGHGLGLNHPQGESFAGYPRIMLTDYYEVMPPYQLASGKLDLRMRKVTEVDVNELKLQRLIFDDQNLSSIGKFETIFLFDGEGEIQNF